MISIHRSQAFGVFDPRAVIIYAEQIAGLFLVKWSNCA